LEIFELYVTLFLHNSNGYKHNDIVKNKKISIIRRLTFLWVICSFTIFVAIPPQYANAQSVLNLPQPGTMISTSTAFNPAIVKGITIYPNNPLKFDFMIDPGDENLQGEELRKEANKLIKYFMASLTVPEDEMWVNLSPYEKDRIIAEGLSQTELGRDLLSQDYILKQVTASLMYSEEELGGDFWQRVYAKAQEKYGISQIPISTFNKVWIIPQVANVYIKGNNVFVVDNYLKVMLEEDYLALESNLGHDQNGIGEIPPDKVRETSDISKKIIREMILPEIEKEVNGGKNFANLRQIFNSMILATWYKKSLRESLLGEAYVNQNKIQGIALQDKRVKQKIYKRYVEAFEKGVYNYIKEDYDATRQKIIPRKYFSGGIDAHKLEVGKKRRTEEEIRAYPVTVELSVVSSGDAAMLADPTKFSRLKWRNFIKILQRNAQETERKTGMLDLFTRTEGEDQQERLLTNLIKNGVATDVLLTSKILPFGIPALVAEENDNSGYASAGDKYGVSFFFGEDTEYVYGLTNNHVKSDVKGVPFGNELPFSLAIGDTVLAAEAIATESGKTTEGVRMDYSLFRVKKQHLTESQASIVIFPFRRSPLSSEEEIPIISFGRVGVDNFSAAERMSTCRILSEKLSVAVGLARKATEHVGLWETRLAPVIMGFSGGPLTDLRTGEVAGIIFYVQQSKEPKGFAIDASEITQWISGVAREKGMNIPFSDQFKIIVSDSQGKLEEKISVSPEAVQPWVEPQEKEVLWPGKFSLSDGQEVHWAQGVSMVGFLQNQENSNSFQFNDFEVIIKPKNNARLVDATESEATHYEVAASFNSPNLGVKVYPTVQEVRAITTDTGKIFEGRSVGQGSIVVTFYGELSGVKRDYILPNGEVFREHILSDDFEAAKNLFQTALKKSANITKEESGEIISYSYKGEKIIEKNGNTIALFRAGIEKETLTFIIQGGQVTIDSEGNVLDEAMIINNKKNKGGIDLNANNLDLNVEGDQIKMNFSNPQNFDMTADGFFPVIINVAPIVHIPALSKVSVKNPLKNNLTKVK